MAETEVNGSPLPVGTQTFAGVWWLPDNPGLTVGGRMTFEPSKGGRLELYGALADELPPLSDVVIFGSCEGRPVTICDARWRGVASSSREVGGLWERTISGERWTCFSVILGIHAPEGNDRRFDTYTLITRGLDEWTDGPRPDLSHPEGDLLVRLNHPDALNGFVVGLGRIHLTWNEHAKYGRSRLNVAMQPRLILEADAPMTRDEAWTTFVTPALLMLTFARGTPDRIVSLGATIRGAGGRAFDDTRVELLVNSWTEKVRPADDAFPDLHLVRLDDVRDDFETFVAAWFELVIESRSSFLDFFANSMSSFLYAEEHFLRVVRAMESWHRSVVGGTFMRSDAYDELRGKIDNVLNADERAFIKMRLQHANERSLRQRLEALIELAGQPVQGLVASYSKFVSKVVTTRNNLAHEGSIGDAFTDIEMIWAAHTLEQIFKSVLLRHLHFDDRQIAEQVGRSDLWGLLTDPGNVLVVRPA